MPNSLFPMGKSDKCSLSEDGLITIPDPVIKRLGWEVGVGDKIIVDFIMTPLTMLFRPSIGKRAGFTLSYLNRSGSTLSGGKLSCSAFVKRYVRPHLQLPLRGLTPVYNIGSYHLALMLEHPKWTHQQPFSKNGQLEVSSDAVGVYQLLSKQGEAFYVGRGNIAERINAHLRREDMIYDVCHFQYLELPHDDAVLLESILIDLHGGEDNLPKYNQRR